jgi:CubicO group peptidase (beta-lactamase class C family)
LVRLSSLPLSSVDGCRRVALDGHVHPEFYSVAVVLRRLLRTHAGGGAVCVYHRGECVVDLWGGTRDGQGNPWFRDTMAPSFSTTKGVASTLLHVLVDKGMLDYEDPVSQHWPEFGQAGKEKITVRQVLAHQSGLYHIRQMIDHASQMLDWDQMIAAIEVSPPIHPPGERTGYHGLTFGYLVGEICQRASGRSFADLVQDEIVEPLGLDGMYIGAPDHVHDRAADLIWSGNRPLMWGLSLPARVRPIGQAVGRAAGIARRGLRLVGLDFDLQSIVDALAPRGIGSFDFSATETLRATIPAANGLFTARSLARMYAALAGGGAIDGVRLLSRETLERATEPQTEAPLRIVIPFDMRWRLGYHGVFTTLGVPRRAFGHFGFGGSGAWADPKRNLAVALIVNSGLGTPFGDLRIARMGGAALVSAQFRN